LRFNRKKLILLELHITNIIKEKRKKENCLSHINALTSAGIPSNMCASTNTNIDMNTKMEVSVGVGVLFNMKNKKSFSFVLIGI